MNNKNASNPPVGKENWGEQKAKLRAKFPTLTDSDLNYDNGKKDEMFGRVQKKLGKTREELNAVMEKL